MTGEQKRSTTLDWTLIGLRCLLLAFLGAASYLLVSSPQNELTTALIVGFGSSILLVIPVLFAPVSFFFNPILLISDWITVALLVYFSRGNAFLMVLIGAGFIVVSSFRLGIYWSIPHTIGILVAVWGVQFELSRVQGIALGVSPEWLPYAVIAIVGIGVNAWVYSLQAGLREIERKLQAEQNASDEQLGDLKERTQMIYEMSAVLGSTLNYEKIMDAAMRVGWVGLRDQSQQNDRGMVSIVLLFRATDNKLHVVASRGLARADENKSLAGADGVIAEALKEAQPSIGERARRDPELGDYISFQHIKSVMCIPLRAGYDNYGIMVYGSPQENAFTDEHNDLLTAIGTQATLALQNAHLYQNLLNERDRLIEAEEEARKKLARDLHDGPTQQVAAIAMRMSVVQKMMERTPREVPAELRKVEEIARQTTKEIRHMLFTLRPIVLENQGLRAALDQLADKFKETHDQSVVIQMGRDVERWLDVNQQGAIFYIIEEAVGNARKHAQAEVISVQLQIEDDMIVIRISDNGVGFDAEAAMQRAGSRGGHLGMINLHERADLLGGTLNIRSAIGKGTIITVLVPVRENRPAQTGRLQQQPKFASKLEVAAMERINSK
jgi:signal transduction histidine kinase